MFLAPEIEKIQIKGKEYPVLFNLNTTAEIQEKFDLPFESVIERLENEVLCISTLMDMLEICINEGIDYCNEEEGKSEKHITAKFIGRNISPQRTPEILSALTNAIAKNSAESEEASPNAIAE